MAQASTSLLDLVTIVIAFSSLMLLLSVLVTSMAQATQAALRLRARNLRIGVAAAIAGVLEDKYKPEWLAREILNSVEVSPLKQRASPHGSRDLLQGPTVSWIDKETLAKALQSTTLREHLGLQEVGEDSVKAIAEGFEAMEPHLRKRFKSGMRAISIVWAFLIALIFQVSAPMLLAELSSDPQARAKYAAMMDQALEVAKTALPKLSATISDKALQTLGVRHPELRSQIEQASGFGSDKADIVGELGLLLKDAPDRDAILKEYEGLLTADPQGERDRALEQARTSMEKLSYLNIVPWRFGSRFYIEASKPQVMNILGVLMTAVLLSLGAPAWFKILQTEVGFRDLLSPPKPKDAGKGAKGKNGKGADREPEKNQGESV